MKLIQKILMGLGALGLMHCAPASFKIAGQKLASESTTGAILGNPASNDAQGDTGPKATVTVNGSDLDIQVPVDTEINVDWLARGTGTCIVNQDDQPVGTGDTGTYKTKTPATPGNIRFVILCQTPTGPISDDINVSVVPNLNPVLIPSSSLDPNLSSTSADPKNTIEAELKVNGEASNIEVPSLSSVQITWTSEGATECLVEPGAQSGLSGTYTTEQLTSSIVATLTCKNSTDTLSITRSVSVPPPPPPTSDLKINGSDGPVIAPTGSPLKITWNSMQATHCTLTANGQNLSVGLQGDLERPAGDLLTTYALKCDGPGGKSSDTVVTAPAVALPTVTITAQGQPNLVEVTPEAMVKIEWSSTNASQCIIIPGPYSGTSGSQMVGPLTKKTEYIAFCEGPFGLAIASVVVIPKTTQMDLALMVNGSTAAVTVLKNSSINISWISTNSKSCQVQPFGFTGLSGKDQLSPPLSLSLKVQLTCIDLNNISKVIEIPITVTEDGKNLSKIDLKVNGSDGPVYVEPNAPVQVVWVTKDLIQCKLNQTIDVEPNGTKVFSVSADSKMTLTCKNSTQTFYDEVDIKIRTNGVVACKLGINIKDGGSWSKLKNKFHGIALCAPSGHFKIYGQEIISQADQKISFNLNKSSTCEHTVTILVKSPNTYSGAFQSTKQETFSLTLKKGQVIEVQVTNIKGCVDQNTRTSSDKLWSQIAPNQCLLK